MHDRWSVIGSSFRSCCRSAWVLIWWLFPRKLTWNLKMMVFNRNLLFQGFIFRFHVSFWGCILSEHSKPTPSVHFCSGKCEPIKIHSSKQYSWVKVGCLVCRTCSLNTVWKFTHANLFLTAQGSLEHDANGIQRICTGPQHILLETTIGTKLVNCQLKQNNRTKPKGNNHPPRCFGFCWMLVCCSCLWTCGVSLIDSTGCRAQSFPFLLWSLQFCQTFCVFLQTLSNHVQPCLHHEPSRTWCRFLKHFHVN